MKNLLATRYQKEPKCQPGCDGWVNVRTGEEGTWDKEGNAIREKEKGND